MKFTTTPTKSSTLRKTLLVTLLLSAFTLAGCSGTKSYSGPATPLPLTYLVITVMAVTTAAITVTAATMAMVVTTAVITAMVATMATVAIKLMPRAFWTPPWKM